MIKKQALILFVIILLGASACKKEAIDVINVGVLRGPTAISMAFLIEESEKFGLENVNFRIYGEPLQLRSAILRDEVDISTVPSIMACNLINKGKDLKIAAIPIWGTLHLYGSVQGITTWEDLRGKEVFMMAEGLTPDIIFKAILKEKGLDSHKDLAINYTFQTHEDLANASIAGRAPLAVLSEPLVSMALEKRKGLSRIFDLNKEWESVFNDSLPLAQTALLVNMASQQLSEKRLKTFLSAYAKCCIYVNSHPEQTADFVVKHKILNNREVALKSIKGCNIYFTRAEDIEQGIINYLNFFYKADARLTGGAPATEAMILKLNN